MIRDWTSSAKVNKLTAQGERFFTRLIMKVDDFGNYPESIKLLNGNLFPDQENIKESDIKKWLSECLKVGVIERYAVDGKNYLHIPNFGQRLDKSKAKYPQPNEGVPADSGNVPGKIPAELELERELEEEPEHEGEPMVLVWPTFEDFWEKYDKKKGKPKAEEIWEKIGQGAREKIMSHLDEYTKGEKQYRKDPERYLKNKGWEDEIIYNTNGHSKDRRQANTDSLKEALANDIRTEFGGG